MPSVLMRRAKSAIDPSAAGRPRSERRSHETRVASGGGASLACRSSPMRGANGSSTGCHAPGSALLSTEKGGSWKPGASTSSHSARTMRSADGSCAEGWAQK
ncbi:hypothetical protein M2165_002299 [Variovorax sp. TBS-050B]|nr:hypothetical protein [Variovorax sp. TBS-050B]